LDEIQYLLIITFTSSYVRNCVFCIYDMFSFGEQRMLTTPSHEKWQYLVIGKVFDFSYFKIPMQHYNKKRINRYCKIIINFYFCNIQNVLPCYMNHFSFDVAMCHSHQHAQHQVSVSHVLMPVHLVSEIIMQSFLIYNADIQLNCVSFRIYRNKSIALTLMYKWNMMLELSWVKSKGVFWKGMNWCPECWGEPP